MFAIQFTPRRCYPPLTPVHLDFWTGVYRRSTETAHRGHTGDTS
jgi:hypothetical protein